MKNIVVFLTLILVLVFTSCGVVKEKVSEEVKKVEEEMVKSTEKSDEKTSDDEKISDDEKSKKNDKKPTDKKTKKDKKKPVDKKDAKLTDADYYAKTTEVIADISNPEFNSYIQEMLIEDLDNDGDIETLTIIDYSVEDYKTVFLMNFDDFERPTTIDFEMCDMIIPAVNVVDIKGVENKVLYLDYDMDDKNMIELYEITEEGFKTLVSSLPEKNSPNSSLGYPTAHVYLLDKDNNAICVYSDGKYVNCGIPCETIFIEYYGKETLYYSMNLEYEFEEGTLKCKSGELAIGPPPETPIDTVMQYLELQYIKSFIFEDGKQFEISGLSDRLALISNIDSELDIWGEAIFLNTPSRLREGRGVKPKFVIDEDINGNEATVVLTLDCDETYFTMWGIRGSDFKAIYHLEMQNTGIWKIVSSEYED